MKTNVNYSISPLPLSVFMSLSASQSLFDADEDQKTWRRVKNGVKVGSKGMREGGGESM